MAKKYSDESEAPVLDPGATPHHGYRGAPAASLDRGAPLGLTIAISREAGSRGATIAKRAGEKLGWEVYSQEMLEYGAQNPALRQEMLEKLTPPSLAWIEQNYQHLLEHTDLIRYPNLADLARLVLTLGAQGNVILLGRGAGFMLPVRSTLHVRLVAPLEDRIAYMSQWLRLTVEEATEQVRRRDHRRTEFLATHFRRKPNDVHLYDMLLNTSLLGEHRCADIVVAAAHAKSHAIG